MFCAENAKDTPFGANTKENPTKMRETTSIHPKIKYPLPSNAQIENLMTISHLQVDVCRPSVLFVGEAMALWAKAILCM